MWTFQVDTLFSTSRKWREHGVNSNIYGFEVLEVYREFWVFPDDQCNYYIFTFGKEDVSCIHISNRFLSFKHLWGHSEPNSSHKYNLATKEFTKRHTSIHTDEPL